LKQHVGHGVPVEGEVEGFAETRVGGGRLRVVKAEGDECGRWRIPDPEIILTGFANEVRGNFDDVGAADLEIEDLAEARIAESDFDGVEEGASWPGAFVGPEFEMTGLQDGGIFGRRGWRSFRKDKGAGA
jgi:hypothetical protein